MKKWLLCLLLFPAPLFAQYSTTVSGNVRTISPNLPPNTVGSYVEFTLVNCGNNTPLVNGVAVLQSGPVDFFADATGAITPAANSNIQPALYGNDAILCGASQTSRYSLRFFVGGIAQGPAKFYYVASNVPFNISTARPIQLLPPLVYPNTTTCAPGSYSNGINNDLSVKCLNLPGAASNAVVTNPTATQEIGNQPLVLDGPISGPLATFNVINATNINRTYYSQAGDTIASIEAQCTSGCTYVVTLAQTFTLSANHGMSSNVNVQFTGSGSWTVNGAFTLTFNTRVEGNLGPHFAGSSSIVFAASQTSIPVEWFGAAGDGTTNDAPAIQKALNSLQSGQVILRPAKYALSAPLVINRNSIGIRGTGYRVTNTGQYPNGLASILLLTSAGIDGVDVGGTDVSHNTAFNNFDNFNIERSVFPTGTATGISLNYTYGVRIYNVGIQDAIRGIYIHASGSQGTGVIEDTAIETAYNGLVETTGSYYGIYIDSGDGAASPSFRIRHCGVFNNFTATGTTLNTYGLYISGTAINDQMLYGFETAGQGYGEYIVLTGITGNPNPQIAASDIHFYGTVNDAFYHGGFFISGLTTAGSGHVEINGGYNATAFTNTSAIDIESSRGVLVANMQLGATTANMNNAVLVHNSSNIRVANNDIQAVTQDGIVLSGSTGVTVTGNTLNGVSASTGLIRLVGSSLNAVGLNTLTGTGASLVVDNASNSNTGLGTNTIAGSLTVASILGLNPFTTSFPGAPSGACTNGSFIGNSLTTAGTFATYQCKGGAWVGVGSAY